MLPFVSRQKCAPDEMAARRSTTRVGDGVAVWEQNSLNFTATIRRFARQLRGLTLHNRVKDIAIKTLRHSIRICLLMVCFCGP